MPREFSTPSPEDAIDVSFFADAFRDSAVPTIIIAPDSTVLFWNTAMERLFGWSAEEAVGRPLPVVPPERWEEHLKLRGRCFGGEGYSQRRITRHDKQGRPVEVTLSTWPIRDAEGRVTAMVGIYGDARAEELRIERALANQQLEELERLYATAPIGLGFIDTDLRFVRVNERLAQINGLSAEAHVGKRLAEVVPEVAASAEGVYREVMESGMPLKERELRAATPALPGVPRDWLFSTYPLKRPDGTILGVTFAVSDITERKRWNEELKRQEALLRLIIDGVPGMVLYVDRDQRYRFANRAAGEWFERPPQYFERRELRDALGDAAFEGVQQGVDRALAGEEVVIERRTRYPDRERDVRAQYVPDRAPNGEVRGMVALVQDITEQKEAERALRDSEERFRRMVEIAAEGIWIVDATARTTFLNNRMAAILGYTKDEMLGRSCFDFYDLEERGRAWLKFQEFRVDKILTPEPREYRFRRKDGTIVWLDITGTPMADDSGAFTGVLKMCTDVTERKNNEQRLRQVQRLESLGILAGGVAHDFNNLLTSILGNTSLVLDTLEPGSRSRGMLQDVVGASERAAQLTRQLLTYAGKDQGRLQPLDAAAAARELVPLLNASIPKMVRLSLELEEGIPLVEADPAQLQQVLMNLVINAAEAIPERTSGEVRIGVGRRRLQPEDYQDAVMPIEDSEREYVSLSVTDNGSGMDPATQARIFDPFFSTKFHGRGLGLSAVLGIVQGHGGTLTLRTAPGKGSTFTLLLPASHVARPAEAPSAVVPEMAAAGAGTVLFVDDEPALRSLAHRALGRRGYHVLAAADGREAIEVLKANPEVRAVVLDLAMPEMTGDVVGPILRELRPDVPLILSSGYPVSDVLEQVGPGVAAAFLEKPYQAAVLAAKVDEVLRKERGS